MKTSEEINSIFSEIKKIPYVLWVISIILLSIPFLYFYWLYPSLPETLPLFHFKMDGTIDHFGKKQDFLKEMILISSISLVIMILVYFLPSIDPLKKAKFSLKSFQKIALVNLILIVSMECLLLYYIQKNKVDTLSIFFPLISIFLIFLGNFIQNIKPNFFVGIKLPWTLTNENNWRSTQQFEGKLYFFSGLIFTMTSIIIPFKLLSKWFMPLFTLILLIPILYSFIYFKRNRL